MGTIGIVMAVVAVIVGTYTDWCMLWQKEEPANTPYFWMNRNVALSLVVIEFLMSYGAAALISIKLGILTHWVIGIFCFPLFLTFRGLISLEFALAWFRSQRDAIRRESSEA